MGTETKVEGLAELEKLLQQLPANIEKNVMRGALRAGQGVIAEAARQKVPVDSGALRDSIRVTVDGQALRRGVVSVFVKAGGAVKGKVAAFYAHMVEFGTARHWIKPKNRKSLFFAGIARDVVDHPGAQAKPFLRPAFDENKDAALQAVADYIRARLPREFRKAGK
jgi:HK97 gp10 family phage protein